MNKHFLDLPTIALKCIASIGIILCVAGLSGAAYRVVSLLDDKLAVAVSCLVTGVMLLYVYAYLLEEEKHVDPT